MSGSPQAAVAAPLQFEACRHRSLRLRRAGAAGATDDGLALLRGGRSFRALISRIVARAADRKDRSAGDRPDQAARGALTLRASPRRPAQPTTQMATYPCIAAAEE